MKTAEYNECMEQIELWSVNNLSTVIQEQITLAQNAIRQCIVGHAGHAATYRAAMSMLYDVSLYGRDDTLVTVVTWLERCWAYAVEYNPTL